MDIASHMRLAVVALLLAVAIQGQSQPQNAPTSGKQDQSKPSASPPLQPSAEDSPPPTLQPKQGLTNAASSPSALASPEQKESFSQLTLFLFGAGLALFIALLGWSDQIRGIDRDTKELEDRFLARTQINKQDFRDIVKPKSPDEQLRALTQVMTSGRINTNDSAELLRTFHTWNGQWLAIERLSAWKYNLTMSLTITLFLAGVVSLFTNPTQKIPIVFGAVRTEMLLLTIPIILIGTLLLLIICSARREKRLRELLESMSDKV
jgi:hypothetical protein